MAVTDLTSNASSSPSILTNSNLLSWVLYDIQLPPTRGITHSRDPLSCCKRKCLQKMNFYVMEFSSENIKIKKRLFFCYDFFLCSLFPHIHNFQLILTLYNFSLTNFFFVLLKIKLWIFFVLSLKKFSSFDSQKSFCGFQTDWDDVGFGD
jgi:hypothetical protein